jgi:hypothetical protein
MYGINLSEPRSNITSGPGFLKGKVSLAGRGWITGLLTGLVLMVFLGFAPNTHAAGTSDLGKVTNEKMRNNPCYKLGDVSLNQNGYVRLLFRFIGNTNFSSRDVSGDARYSGENYIRKCKMEVYFAKSNPAGKIRGVKGLNGSKAEKTFSILLEPDAKGIFIDLSGDEGNLAKRYFNIVDYISIAKGQVSGWQTAWKGSEQTLQEASANDKTPPKIVLQSPDVTPQRHVFRVDTYQTFVRGKASDAAGIATVLVNGKKAGIKADGSFAKKVKLAIGLNKMIVQAADIHGNVAKRSFSIIREEFISDEIIADVDIPQKTKMNNPDGIGVVIGVESYQYVANATYAYNDAEVFREYLASTLGFKKSRIKLATNSKATQAELSKLLGPNGWIARNVKAQKSDVVVYFSGHGIPDAKTKETGLLPFDVDPQYSVGLGLKDLYKALGKLNARSVTVFLDTCFSGQGREKQTLLAGTRGIQIVPKERNVPGNITVLSAATAGQVSGPFKDKEHGLFTYYLLKGLGGAADGDQNKKLTMTELAAYVHSKVKDGAALTGREQTPELQGGGERVLVQW